LAFKFADFHFSEQQSSATAIDQVLELWAAQSANDVYATIDEIQQGDDPWKSVVFCYQGHLSENLPKWMTEDFKIVTRDIRSVLYEQISCTNFNGHWDYEPFMEFWTNLMSADWVAKQSSMYSLGFIYFIGLIGPVEQDFSGS
jgi:hypothetical protein